MEKSRMATQRLIVAKIGGRSALLVEELFRRWERRATEDRTPSEISSDVDEFAQQLIAHGHCPPILYFAQWIDLWSMGDLVPGLGDKRAIVVAGRQFETCCHRPPIEMRWALIGGKQTQETRWLRGRIREAEMAWSKVVADGVIVVLREPLGALVTDEELTDSLRSIPT
jgi:hypothetical protein